MSNPIMVPPTVPLNNYPGMLAPYSNVAPFLDTDRRTFQHQLEGFIHWLNNDVIHHTDTTFATIGERLNEFTNLTAAQQAQWKASVDAAILAYKNATGVDIAKYEGYFDTTVQTVTTIRNAATAARTAAEVARDESRSSAADALAASAATVKLQADAVALLFGNSGTLPSNPATAALVKAIRATMATRAYPARFGFEGDSITDSALAQSRFTNQWWGLAAGDKYWPAVEAGVSGETTTQMRARIATDFPAGSVDSVMILGGTNDIGQAFPLATTIANITAMVDYVRSIKATPILGTIPPRAETAAVDALNGWLRDYAYVNNITLVDFWTALATPVTKVYKAGYTSDGIHPTPKGHKVMADVFKAAISSYLTNAPALVRASNANDTRNALANGMITSWPAMPAIVAPTTAVGGTGSPLEAGTYYYKVSYLGYAGESATGPEVSATITAGQSITLTIPVLPGQGRVVIYRSTASNAEQFLTEVNAGGAPTVFVDNGSIIPPGNGKVPSPVNHYIFPTGWSSGGGLGAMNLTRRQDDTDFINDAVDLEVRAPSTIAQVLNYTTLPVKYDTGDVVAVSFKVKSFGGLVNRALAHLRKSDNSDANTAGITNGEYDAFTDTVKFYTEVKCAADVTSVGIDFTVTGTGSIRAGDVSFINLTKLGLR